MKQWVMRITAYADRLLDDLSELDWPESIKLSQKNWIGKSEGAEIKFSIDNNFKEYLQLGQIQFWCNISSISP